MDGTMIHKMGYITGGLTEDVESRAAKWDDDRLAALRQQRTAVDVELRQLPTGRDRQLEDLRLTSELRQIEHQIENLKSEGLQYDRQKEEKQQDVQKSLKEKAKLQPEIASAEAVLAERQGQIQKLQDRINTIADREFGDFSRRLGVQNYREYEAQHLQKAQRIRKRRQEFETQIGHLQSQLEYETSRDLQKPIEAIYEKLQGDTATLDRLDQHARLAQQRKQQVAGEAEGVSKEVGEMKVQAGRCEIELQECRTAAEGHRTKICSLQSQCTTLQTQTEFLKEQKTDVLQNTALETGSDVEPDFDLLEAGWLVEDVLQDAARQSEVEQALRAKIAALRAQLQCSAPNLRATDQLNQIKDREVQQTERLEAARARATQISESFREVHRRRRAAFMEAFQHVSAKVDEIYKDLTKSDAHPHGGSAALYLESEEMPFLHGIRFSAIPPTKRYREMEQLSGGEKTVVALALLFAVHSYRPCPFFILDEIDASLDAANVRRVADYIRQRTRENGEANFQSIVISLKHSFFHKADSLVGITRDSENGGSEVLTFDLEAFQERQCTKN